MHACVSIFVELVLFFQFHVCPGVVRLHSKHFYLRNHLTVSHSGCLSVTSIMGSLLCSFQSFLVVFYSLMRTRKLAENIDIDPPPPQLTVVGRELISALLVRISASRICETS